MNLKDSFESNRCKDESCKGECSVGVTEGQPKAELDSPVVILAQVEPDRSANAWKSTEDNWKQK